MGHSVSLLFNVDDLCWPGSDDAALAVADHLSRRDIRATFMIVGERSRLLAERGRRDVIAALRRHDIGLHTAFHAVHPTLTEYLADQPWPEGVLAAYDEEGAALGKLEHIFGVKAGSWGQAGGAWAPQVNAALYRLNLPAVVYAPTRTQAIADLHWYAGALVFPEQAIFRFEEALLNDHAFEAAMQTMQTMLDDRLYNGARWTGIFVAHPARLRAKQDWAALNFAGGRNTPPEDYAMPQPYSEATSQAIMARMDRLLHHLTEDHRLQLETISQVRQAHQPPRTHIYLSEIDRLVWQLSGQDDIPTTVYHFSAAELLDVIARVYSDPEAYPDFVRRRTVFGPVEAPPPFDPSNEPIYWSDFVAACRMVENYINYHHTLPANVYLGRVAWSIGAFFRAALTMWPQFRAGRPPHFIEWQPAYMYPAIGHDIAEAVQAKYENWPPLPNALDVNTLLMHTCFQCWTLRPAYESADPR